MSVLNFCLPPRSLAIAHHLRNGVDELLSDSVVPRVVLLRLGVGRRVRQSLLKEEGKEKRNMRAKVFLNGRDSQLGRRFKGGSLPPQS